MSIVALAMSVSANAEGYSPDEDGDGIQNYPDNCPLDANSDQTDTDGDAKGDACDVDADGNGVLDREDCPAGTTWNGSACEQNCA
ncbi:MAG: thrombospondin type 3 repeat-containing protein, partial [Patescibacteria group bacterium]